jgi:fructuronate reductase
LKPPANRDPLQTGIVHFGPGAFHRAHQADYIDRLLEHDPRWGIAAVSLRTASTIDALRRQDGLYTLAILDEDTSFRTIGAHNRFYGPGENDGVRRQLADPAVAVVSSTVTEKGYCLAGDGTLDFNHPDITHDLAHPEEPSSLIGWLVLGLRDRRSSALPPFTPLCCDNMASNGKKLRAAVLALAERNDPDLARWIEGEVRFPDTMVDSITPATDEHLRKLVREATSFDDAVPVGREAYAEWVIEDILPPGFPDLASAGVKIAGDVAVWEKAKLRILNGAHSTLAYLGLLLGHETVHDAMADPALSSFVQRLAVDDIVPSLLPSPIDLDRYVEQTLQRFRNPAIRHRLAQIAWDGSQKLPYRLLDTIIDARSAGRPIGRLALPVAAWICFLERQTRHGAQIVDPLADELSTGAISDDAAHRILQLRQIFPEQLAADSVFADAVSAAVSDIRQHGPLTAITRALT